MAEEQDRTRDEQEPGDDPGDEVSGAEVAEQEPDGEDAEAEAMKSEQSD